MHVAEWVHPVAKQKVALLGASGTMGRQAFLELWRRRKQFDIVLLLQQSEHDRWLFEPYASEAGIDSIPPAGTIEGDGLKIVRGDATRYQDVQETVESADCILNAMACISPQADYHPKLAKAVNMEAIQNVVRAVEAQPNGREHVKLIHTASVAQTGDRLPPIHRGRVGDPLKPSIFDYYAVTKIAGERAVTESSIRHWVSLRMTFIMPTTWEQLSALQGPIAFHMPLATLMENVTDRGAGFGMVNCLDIPDASQFWRKVYNMGGGPSMRCTAYELNDRMCKLVGMSGVEACSERRWYALRNFHMQHFEDSGVLNDYLHYWRDSMQTYWESLNGDLPARLRLIRFLCAKIPAFRRCVERAAYRRNKRIVTDHRNGTVYWYNHRNDRRISAFYRNYQTYESISRWRDARHTPNVDPAWHRLSHGYDEAKQPLDLSDLRGAAQYRGGSCLSAAWDGDMYTTLSWKCAFDHEFTAKPYTIIKAGHWCPACVAPPWNYHEQAAKSPFFAQVWHPNHDPDEHEIYPEDCLQDIVDADRADGSGTP